MAVKHRRQRRRVKRVATLGAATATITALTVGVAPPTAHAAAVQRDVRLQSGMHLFPPPNQIPDLTGGLGTAAYNLTQDLGAQVANSFVQSFNLLALMKAAGIDPNEAVRGVVNDALGGVLGGTGVADATLDFAPLLGQIGDALGIGPILDVLGPLGLVPTEVPIGQLLTGLGIDLTDPLASAGINVITAGGPFTLLRLLGVDLLGWQPSFPNSIADDINNTEYLSVGMSGVLGALGIDLSALDDVALGQVGGVLDQLVGGLLDDVLGGVLGGLFPGSGGISDLSEIREVLNTLTDIPDVVDVRIPIVAGWGLGAFAAGAAYQQVVDDLPNQPGGANYQGTSPLLGSFTILPMVLLDNPGRANGGILARAYPLFRLLGIDTVTPETQVQSSSKPDNIFHDTQVLGLTVGGANLIPIKIDASAEYLPMSDFAAWPNPFTLANNLAAGMFPSYTLRNQTVEGILADVVAQIGGQLLTDLGGIANDPTAGPELNYYYTLRAQSLPLLEPTYLAYDVVNLLTGANLNNPIGTALSPVLTSLVNLGYTDVFYDPDTGIYDRTLTEAGIPTAFGTLPADVDWGQVPMHLVNNLVTGIQKAFDDGLVNQNPVPSPLQQVLGLLGLGGGNGILPAGGSGLNLPGLTEALENLSPDLGNTVGPQGILKTSFAPQGVTDIKTGGEEQKIVDLDAVAGRAALEEDTDTAEVEPAADEEKSTVEGGTEKIVATAGQARQDVKKSVTQARERAKNSAEQARERTAKAFKDAQERVNKVAEDGRKQIKSAAEGIEKGVQKAANGMKPVKKAEKKTEKKDTKNDGD